MRNLKIISMSLNEYADGFKQECNCNGVKDKEMGNFQIQMLIRKMDKQ